jgi:hypothetical protein
MSSSAVRNCSPAICFLRFLFMLLTGSGDLSFALDDCACRAGLGH